MNVAVLFSGGKDSTMAVYAALEAKEDVKYPGMMSPTCFMFPIFTLPICFHKRLTFR